MYMKKRTRILSVFLTVAILITSMVIVFPTTAEEAGAAGTKPAPTELWSEHHAQSFANGIRYGTDGYGTARKPYEISTAEELAYLAWIVNKGEGNAVTGKYFVLTADIDLSDYIWVPIAKSYTADAKWDFEGNGVKEARRNTFSGIFDGGGHTITGLTFNSNMLDANGYLGAEFGGLGLFGRLAGTKDSEGRATVTATVKNVSIVGSADLAGYRSSSSQFGAPVTMVATAAYDCSLIENVHVTTDMNIVPQADEIAVAGIVGYATNMATLSGCSVSGTITVDAATYNKMPAVGGLVCRSGNSLLIQNCVNNANIVVKAKGSNAYVGGICAKTQGSAYAAEGVELTVGMDAVASIVNTVNYGDITVENKGNSRVGGIIGNAGRGLKGDALLVNCFNFGDISVNYIGANGGVGAMIGLQETRRVQMTDCYSFTKPVCTDETDTSFIPAFICNAGGLKETNGKIFYSMREYYTPTECRFLSPDVIETYDGAALRINPSKVESASLRFESKVGGQLLEVMKDKTVVCGTLAIKASDLNAALEANSNLNVAIANVSGDSISELAVVDQKPNGAFSSVYTNLKEDKHAIEYVAISYVTIVVDEDADFSLTFYSDYERGDAARVISVKSIAEVYYGMRQDMKDGVYKNEVGTAYSQQLGKYSLFTDEQLEIFKLYMSAELEDLGNGSNGLEEEVDENQNS